MSEAIVIHAARDLRVEDMTPVETAMAEPLTVCLHATRRAGPLLGKSVLVTVCGPICILCILAARRAGADFIMATDLGAFTLGMAAKAGADLTINMAQDSDHLAGFAADKGHFDVLFECSGATVALTAAIPTLRPGGTIVQLGLGGDMTLPVQAMTAKELTLKGWFRFHEEFHTGVSLMQKGLIDVKPFITHSFGLDQALTAFDTASDRSRAMKVQIGFTAA